MRQSSDSDVDALQAVCERLCGFDDRVSLEWLDGTLAALAAGPRVPTLEEALPLIFDDTWSRTFADPQDDAQALATVRARWRVLLSQLDPDALADQFDALRLTPLILQPAEGDPADGWLVGEDWGRGFLQVALNPAWGWTAAADGAELGDALSCIAALTITDPEELAAYCAEHGNGQTLTRDALLDDACFAAQDVRLWWIDHAPKTAPRRVEATPGRNDPCPCGSGLKYKKCHGLG